jgi:Breast carcinoma amplified sequence 2 (BCAS2)
MEQPAPLFDSLPYYDNDLEIHPILREKVQHELAVETQKIQQETLHPRVPPPVELFVVSLSNARHGYSKLLACFFRTILSSLQSYGVSRRANHSLVLTPLDTS